MTYNTSWNIEDAKSIFAKLTKVANDMVDTVSPDAESAGTAGPQEVVDALSGIIGELEAISAAIPAEASQGDEAGLEGQVNPPKEPEVVAQLKTQIAELTTKVESAEKEKVALKYAELFSDAKVKEAKYNEVMESKEKPEFWAAKVETVEDFQKETGTTQYRPAQTTHNWIQPRTRVAQQGSKEIMRL